MTPEETLTSFAEVGSVFAGFAGLAGALSRQFAGEAAEVAATRLRGTVELSLIVVSFSLLPLLALRLASDEPLTWRLLSVGLALTVACYFAIIYRAARALPLGGPLWRVFGLTWMAAGLPILLANGAGVFEDEAGYYMLGLLGYLLMSMFLFARLFRSLLSRGAR